MFLYYSRVSTVGQNSGRQLESFRVHGSLTTENVFIDKIQGNVPFFERPEAVKLFEVATTFHGTEPVTVVVDSIDRLGRNLLDILKTIDTFTRNSINLKFLKEGFETIINGKENPLAKIVISVMGSIAELERNRIKDRQSEGIAIAKAHGRFKGRKVGSVQSTQRLLERHAIIVQKLKKGMSVRDVAEISGKSTATVMKVKKVLG